MTSSTIIHLQIGKSIPPGDERETREIIEIWHKASAFFADLPFSAQGQLDGTADSYRLSLNAEKLIAAMENARDQSDSFSMHRLAHEKEPGVAVAGELSVTVSANDRTPDEEEIYRVATVFLQQVVLAFNLLRPGAVQFLDTRFSGEGAHKYEAQSYDSRIFYGAWKAAQANEWPPMKKLGLEELWSWLEGTESSQMETAITSINKVLFTLLKVAQQRHEYSARMALLVMYQLETMLECRHLNSLTDLRQRTALVFEDFPESSDWLTELYNARQDLFMASVPVHRPALICHATENVLPLQPGRHHSTVELGLGLVLALLHDLIAHGATRYTFSEILDRH